MKLRENSITIDHFIPALVGVLHFNIVRPNNIKFSLLSESCENILVQGAIWFNLNISGCTKDLRKYLAFVTAVFV